MGKNKYKKSDLIGTLVNIVILSLFIIFYRFDSFIVGFISGVVICELIIIYAKRRGAIKLIDTFK